MWKNGTREAVSGETPHPLSTFRVASPRLWALSHRAQEVAEGDSKLCPGHDPNHGASLLSISADVSRSPLLVGGRPWGPAIRQN